MRGLGLSLPDTTVMLGIPYQSQHNPILIEFRCSFKSLFNTTLQTKRTKSSRVGALIENYSPVLVLGLECLKTKFGHYSTGIGSR